MKRLDNTMRPAESISSGTISPENATTANRSVRFVISGQPVSLKNRRRLLKNPRNGKTFSVKSADAERYMSDFCRQVPAKYRNLKLGSLERPLRVTIRAFYVSRRSDVDMAIVFDALQVSEVIANDRYIVSHEVQGFVDPKNPRVEIEVREL